MKLIFFFSSEEGPSQRVNNAIFLVFELSLTTDLSILVVILSPPGLRISLDISSSLIHFNIVLMLKTRSDIVKLFLTVKNIPEKSFIKTATRKLHNWIKTFTPYLEHKITLLKAWLNQKVLLIWFWDWDWFSKYCLK